MLVKQPQLQGLYLKFFTKSTGSSSSRHQTNAKHHLELLGRFDEAQGAWCTLLCQGTTSIDHKVAEGFTCCAIRDVSWKKGVKIKGNSQRSTVTGSKLYHPAMVTSALSNNKSCSCSLLADEDVLMSTDRNVSGT